MFARVFRFFMLPFFLTFVTIVPQGASPVTGNPTVQLPPAQAEAAFTFHAVYDAPLHDYTCENNLDTADFDQDGVQDIVLLETRYQMAEPGVPEIDSKLVLLHGDGGWTYSETVVAQYAAYGHSVRAADMNNDGWADLVVRENSAMHVYLNQQNGQFVERWRGGTNYDLNLDIADVNGDGLLDIIAGGQGSTGGYIQVYLNRISGACQSFSKGWRSEDYGEIVPGTISDVFAANLNDDGFMDIAAIEMYSGLLLTFTGDGTGKNFTERTNYDLGGRSFSLAPGDINQDGLMDMAVNVDEGMAHVFVTSGNAEETEVWSSPNTGAAALNTGFADFDQDGHLDYFTETFRDGALRIYQGQPTGAFDLTWTETMPGKGYTGKPADMDADGDPDLIVEWKDGSDQSTIQILENQTTAALESYLYYLVIISSY